MSSPFVSESLVPDEQRWTSAFIPTATSLAFWWLILLFLYYSIEERRWTRPSVPNQHSPPKPTYTHFLYRLTKVSSPESWSIASLLLGLFLIY